MIKRLEIRNFAVIEELSLELGPGLQVLTGETGAGKSVLIEALGFLLGGRSSPDWLRSGAERLSVAGEFAAGGAVRRLERELDAGGRSRARLDGKPASAKELAALAEDWVDFHGQHEHQALLKTSRQLDILDRCAGLEPLLEELGAAWKEHRALEQRVEALKLSEEERLRRLDLYRFQLKDIDETAPKKGEEEQLEAQLPRLQNAERLRNVSGELAGALSREEGSAKDQLARAQREAEELARLDPGAGEIVQLIAQARISAEEAAERVSVYRDGVDLDPAKLDDLLTRQDKLAKLRKKYGPALDDVLAYRERIAGELQALENRDQEIEALQAEQAKVRRKLEKLSSKAHDERAAAAKKLSAQIACELRDLGMPGSRFSISVEMEEGAFGPQGADQVEFLIAPNPGEPLKSLRSIASGGELSRTMLALKTALSKADRVPILVFDEVDAGVGGAVARSVGQKLASLAQLHQVLVITHLPQIACYADGHLRVSKSVAAGRTRTRIEPLASAERLEELSRMLGGQKPTPVSKQHAQELLEAARKERAALA